MNRLAEVAADARSLAQESLGRELVQDVRVADYIDEAGEHAYKVLIVVNEFDPDVLTPDRRSAFAVALIRKLGSEGDSRFPFISFVPRDELAELTAND